MKYFETIRFRAEPETADWLRDEAERRGKTLSEVIRLALSHRRPQSSASRTTENGLEQVDD